MTERGLLYAIIFAAALFVFLTLAAIELYLLARNNRTWRSDYAMLVYFIFGGFLLFLLIPSAYVGSYASSLAGDGETWGGFVNDKKRYEVSCSHDYCCGWRQECTTDSEGRQSCQTVCSQTCYDHPFDVDWDVHTDLGTYSISRIDRQGINEPPRWTSVVIGEPVAERRRYQNWIKAAKFSLLHRNKTELDAPVSVPRYPDGVYDYWHTDRFIAHGVKVPDLKGWNADLMKVNGAVGPIKQASVLVVVTNQPTRQWATSLYDAWMGGAKNDVLVVVGAPQFPTIDWVEVRAMTTNSLFPIQLRNDLQDLGTMDRSVFFKTIGDNVKKLYVRERMRNYVYLKDQLVPPMSNVIWILAIQAVLIFGFYGFVRHEEFLPKKHKPWS